MKIKHFILPLALILSTSVFAQDVHVPIVHKLVPADGLTISYDMGSTSARKVTCLFENFYKAYLTYVTNGAAVYGPIFGNGKSTDQINFTSAGPTIDDGAFDQEHVDYKSYITVKSASNTPAYATCFYVSEDSK